MPEAASPHYSVQRQHRRFILRHPVRLQYQKDDALFELEGVSNNVSLGGLLLETRKPVPAHCEVSFVLTVQGQRIVPRVRLFGSGQVVRVVSDGEGFKIAVKCHGTISQLEKLIPSA